MILIERIEYNLLYLSKYDISYSSIFSIFASLLLLLLCISITSMPGRHTLKKKLPPHKVSK